jgi:N-acetylneuraminate lyase
MALSQGERKALAVAWVAARSKYGVKVVNHIGAQSITEACELAQHAQEIGCDAICAMAPQFFKPLGPMGLAKWLQAIGRAAPKLPLY